MATWDLLYGGANSDDDDDDDDWFNDHLHHHHHNEENMVVATTHHNHRPVTTLPPEPQQLQQQQQPPPPSPQKSSSQKRHLRTYTKPPPPPPPLKSLQNDIDVIDLTQSPPPPPVRTIPLSLQHPTATANPSSSSSSMAPQLWPLLDDDIVVVDEIDNDNHAVHNNNSCNNPYRQKRVTPTTTSTTKTTPPFIGGAAMARKKARHDLFDHWKNSKTVHNNNNNKNKTVAARKPTRIVLPGEDFISLPSRNHHHHHHNKDHPPPIPIYRNTMERFYHAVLHWPWSEYVAANAAAAQITLWERMCHCLRLDPSSLGRAPIQSTYPDIVTHCQVRTMVLLEEVRNTLCEGVAKLLPHLNNNNSGRNPHGGSTTHSHHHHQPKYQWIQLDVKVVAMEPCDKSSSNSSRHPKKHAPTTTTALEPNFRIMVQSGRSFTKHELFHIRPGAVFVLRSRSLVPPNGGGSSSSALPIFGVVTTGNREMVEQAHKFEVMIFNEFERFTPSHDLVTITYVTQLVTEFRCYEALNTNYHIHFEAQLLGNPEPPPVPSSTHTRFIDSDDDSTNHPHEDRHSYLVKVTPKKEKKNADIHHDSDDDSTNHPGEDRHSYLVPVTPPGPTNDHDPPLLPAELVNSTYFVVPPLNPTQNRVATQFLQSPSGKITLVQGPPGTGKTTLLVSILCCYLIQSMTTAAAAAAPPVGDDQDGTMDPSGSMQKRCDGRIMVCAPTNKAVQVLASRFVKAMQKDSNVSFNIILVGDADKIFMDDRSSHRNSSNNIKSPNQGPTEAAPTATQLSADQLALRSIFLYTWIPSIVEGYVRILSYFSPRYTGSDTPATLWQLSKQLQQRLTSSLTHLPPDFVQRMNKIVSSLQFIASSSTNPRMLQDNSIRKDVENHIGALKKLPKDVVWEQLLRTANVIFCTLASAGGSIVKKTEPIHDLIVDEAAAATEPELYIPFYLQPKRLLVVGDPLQLPATVISRRAIALGYTKSLHERLMYDCKYDHMMLDVQYRMNPEISSFPSFSFYKNKIQNGENVNSVKYANGAILLDRMPYTFLQVEGQEERSIGGSHLNRKEASIIVDLIEVVQRKTSSSAKPREWCGSDRIRVITFYQAQVQCIQKCLEDRGLGNTVVVATVDSSQGCEADIVLISFVRSQGSSYDEWQAPPSSLSQSLTQSTANLGAGFLNDDRRMNVALTRAKYQLICVGNVRQFSQIPNAETLHLLAENAEARGIINDSYATTPSKTFRPSFSYT